ncbi:MAG: hypothetical protein JSW58_09345 [Candidatus Latescibacterota bacterium]|nr:MAG: hypothetical protein JSW58_09345 [Candidatus Latescibacterota bacterium]
MSRKKLTVRCLSLIVLLSGLVVPLSQCSDDPVSPDPPESITILSGNLQYSKRGTELPMPLIVEVTTAKGEVPQMANVAFDVVTGDGSLSRTAARVNTKGRASTSYTLGPGLGTNIIRATLQENTARWVEFEATSSNFFCPEQEDTFRVDYGTARELFLATHKSILFPPNVDSEGNLLENSGVVLADALSSRTTRAFADIDASGIFDSRIYDAAFSAKGEFFVARLSFHSEILKVDQAGGVSQFAILETNLPEPDPAVELTLNPSGLLIGCDVMGPFVVGCRNEISRFPDDAMFVSGGINNDALAVDPRRQSNNALGEDIYFIHKPNTALLRLPLDSLTVEPQGVQLVTSLTADEANYARGMVCDTTGTVYILVDSDETKELLSVTPDGTKTVLVDFFIEQGQGDAAGMQRDLAIEPLFPTGPLLFTLDTLNDDILLYDTASGDLTERFENQPVDVRTTLSIRGELGELTGGERVGLAVLMDPTN